LVFGPTGSGKTSTAIRAIELALKRGSERIIIDWKGEYSGYFNGATTIRKIDLPRPEYVDYETHSLVVVDILRDVLELSDPMAYNVYATQLMILLAEVIA
jgi:hypothetical protein